MVSPKGVFTLEVKSHRGTVTFDNGSLLRDGKTFEKDFLKQAWAECFAVREILAKWDIKEPKAEPLIVFSNAFVKTRGKANGVIVTSGARDAAGTHLKPFFRGLVSDVDVRSIEVYKSLRMAKGISSWTMNSELKVISCILKFGVENKYLEEIPRIRRVKIQKKSPRFLSAEEIGKVLASARPDVPPMLQFMIFTGFRKGEVRFLEWSDVDLQHRLVHVRPKETWSPKTESSARIVPLCDPALEALQMAWERAERRKVKSTLVFPGRKGPLNDIRDSLNGACERASVPHIRVHGLRHTFGSQMAMAGADPFAIMKAMGHTDIKTTMIYVSLGKSHIREQVEKLNAIHLLPPPALPTKLFPISRARRNLLQ